MSSIAFLRRSLGTVGRNERFGVPPRVVVLLGVWATSVCGSAPRELVDRRVADSTTGSSCMSSVTLLPSLKCEPPGSMVGGEPISTIVSSSRERFVSYHGSDGGKAPTLAGTNRSRWTSDDCLTPRASSNL
jgi:hypothetical protein